MTQGTLGNQYKLSALEFSLAGATTGVITRFCCQPLDVLKIRFQLQVSPISKNSQQSKYQSIFQAAKIITKEEGIFAFWKGHIPAQYLSLVFGAVQFGTYEKLNALSHNYRLDNHTWIEPLLHFGYGSVAGLTAVAASFPFDVIRTRLIAQDEPKVYHSVKDAAVKIWQKEGFRGFNKGISAGFIQVVPLSGLTFGFHNLFTKTWMTFEQVVDSKEKKSISTTGSLICGSLAGLCGKTIVYPLDLIKKRLQIQGFDEKRTCLKKLIRCTGFIQCIVITVKFEGFLGLFKGLGPSMLKAGATNAIYFTVYDKVCQFLVYAKR